MTVSKLSESSHRQIGARVYVDPSAVVIGSVTIGDDSSIWPTAVLRGDVHSIEIGARTSIQDGSVLHVTHDGPYSPGGRALIIGSNVTVGHRVVLHACTIGNCLSGRYGIDPPRRCRDRGFCDDRRGQRCDAGQASRSAVGSTSAAPARRVRELNRESSNSSTYSAAHYVKVKDEYLAEVIRES